MAMPQSKSSPKRTKKSASKQRRVLTRTAASEALNEKRGPDTNAPSTPAERPAEVEFSTDPRALLLSRALAVGSVESPDPRRRISHALTALVGLTDASTAAFSLLQFDPSAAQRPERAAAASGLKFIDVIEGGQWPANARQSYMDYLNDEAAADPFLAVFLEDVLKHPAGTIHVGCRREHLSDEPWYTSRHYTRYRGAVGFDDCVYGAVVGGRAAGVRRDRTVHALDDEHTLPPSIIAGFSIHKRKDASPFSVRDRELARLALAACVVLGAASLRSDRTGASGLFAQLTPRQRDVLILLNEGLAVKQIAARLNLTAVSVHTYVQTICRRLGVRGRSEALALCNKKGWLVGLGVSSSASKT